MRLVSVRLAFFACLALIGLAFEACGSQTTSPELTSAQIRIGSLQQSLSDTRVQLAQAQQDATSTRIQLDATKEQLGVVQATATAAQASARAFQATAVAAQATASAAQATATAAQGQLYKLLHTPPSAPSIVDVYPGDGAALVIWTPPVDAGGSTVTAYSISASPSIQVTAGPNQTMAMVSGLTNGTSYFITVTAINIAGLGQPSAPFGAVVPGAHLVTPYNGSVAAVGPIPDCGGVQFATIQLAKHDKFVIHVTASAVIDLALATPNGNKITIGNGMQVFDYSYFASVTGTYTLIFTPLQHENVMASCQSQMGTASYSNQVEKYALPYQ